MRVEVKSFFRTVFNHCVKFREKFSFYVCLKKVDLKSRASDINGRVILLFQANSHEYKWISSNMDGKAILLVEGYGYTSISSSVNINGKAILEIMDSALIKQGSTNIYGAALVTVQPEEDSTNS
jgi:hypothetical protein